MGVGHFVNISTGKAANPTSAHGHSKRLAEQPTSRFYERSVHGKYLSVRFGNVLRGSVNTTRVQCPDPREVALVTVLSSRRWTVHFSIRDIFNIV